MDPKSRIKYLLVGVLLIASCSSFAGLDFNLDTASPQKTYLVKLEGRGESFTSTVQQVKLTVLKGAETIAVDVNFYREEVDHPFSEEFPVHEWMSDSVLRLGKENTAQSTGDKIVVINNGNDRLDVLKVEYASRGEKFLIFDLDPGARVELKVLPSGQSPNPSVEYAVYASGIWFAAMAREWRTTDAGSEIVIEPGQPLAEVKSERTSQASIFKKPSSAEQAAMNLRSGR